MALSTGTRQLNRRNGVKKIVNCMPISKRFSDIPTKIEIPIQDQEEESVEIDLLELADDPTELCTLFEMEGAARTYWMTVALAYVKQRKVDFAIEMLIRGATAIQANNPREKLGIVTCLCWLYLWKSREAPRVPPEGTLVAEAKTKEYWLQQATQTLNDGLRINPAFPPLFLARGVLQLLRASLQSPSKANSSAPGAVDPEKADILRSALKAFDDAIRVSGGRNMLAVLGRARALFSLGKVAEALTSYQEVLSKMPDLVDPDPRIGIGCCFWQLGFKDDAKTAWERCLEINAESKIAQILLGLYYLDSSGHIPTNSPAFINLYKKAMTEYTQTSFKLDKNLPLTCVTFANYFLSRRNMEHVDSLAHKAIQQTDVNAIASDGWYLLARKEHYEGNLDRASDFYRRADDARGGAERGYLPAKFGAAQLCVMRNDLAEAKLRLEKMIQKSKNYEAMILLGSIYAEEFFASQNVSVKEDKTAEAKKAITLLEGVRSAWKDPNRTLAPDAAVLLNLARLYETDSPDKALQCLEHVEQMEMARISPPTDSDTAPDEPATQAAHRAYLPPQLLNNKGCFHSQLANHEEASDMFEAALSSCMRISKSDENADTDALVTTISYNLGRSYESRGMPEEAVKIYEGLLKRHDDYTDAQTRLAYVKLRKNWATKEGADAVASLYQENPTDLEVRAFYGWYLNQVYSKKRSPNLSEDPEHKHHKYTLQSYDKHDRYALVGIGNMFLQQAREMRRETDQDKQKRSHTYSRAVEFFDKALQLDPKNAYAAQGIAIALIEDKKDHKSALQTFLKVKDTIKDHNVHVNLGHIYAELKQFSKAIENYEVALSKEGRENDSGILSCLGRTWLNRGRTEHNLDAYKEALECAQKALRTSPDQVHYKFNVAFVQIQIAMQVYSLGETQRNSFQLETAAEGLEAAIQALDEIASSPQTPYPKHDIEQRANMARNTQRRQLERAIASQKDYESKNKEKQAAALEMRQAELRRREEARKKAGEEERSRQEEIRKERELIAARDREMAVQRADEERARAEAEMTTDSETGEKVKRKRKAVFKSSRGEGGEKKPSRPRKKKIRKDEESGNEDERARKPPKKKIRLNKSKEAPAKFKSAEIVVDSSDDEYGRGASDDDMLERAERELAKNGRKRPPLGDESDGEGRDPTVNRINVDDAKVGLSEEDEEEQTIVRPQRSKRDRIVDESDEDNNESEVELKAKQFAKQNADDDKLSPPPEDTSMQEPTEE